MKKIFPLFLCSIFMFACSKKGNNTNSSNNNNTIPKVTACFTIGTTTPVTSTAIIFDASCSKNATTYVWRVDGIPLSTVTVTASNTFSTAGMHTISLLAIGLNGAGLDSTSQTINVTKLTPTACFNVTSPYSSDSSYPVNTQITFDATCSRNADGEYEWNYGDRDMYGDPDIVYVLTPYATHAYSVKGTYTVKLGVTNQANNTGATKTRQITIY